MAALPANPAPSRWSFGRIAGGRSGWLVLLLICAAVYLPGLFTLPPVDRDESRFAQASRQMLESGDFAIPRVQDRPRLNKPPLIYWLQSASASLFGDRDRPNAGIWVYRVPSALCAAGAVVLTWRLGRRLFDPRAAFLAAVLLAVCPMVVWDAHQARADQLLLLSVLLTQFALWEIWSRSRHDIEARIPLTAASAFWIALSIGVMAKGPITPMIAALTALGVSIVDRRWRWLLALRPLLGILVLAALVGPWVYRVGSQVGWDQYLTIIRNETIGRTGEAKEGHWGPPGYHLILSAVLFWPGSLFAAAAVIRAWPRAGIPRTFTPVPARPRRARSAELFLLAWLLPSWIVFELVGTKLPHYTMPLYPALALLSARTVLHAASRGPRYRRDLGVFLGELTWLLIGLCLAITPAAIWVALAHPLVMPRPSWPIVLVSAGMVIALAGAKRAFKAFTQRDYLRAQLVGVALALTLPTLLIEVVLASAPELALSSRVAAHLYRLDRTDSRPVAAVEYHEDSLVFSTRGRLIRLDVGPLAAFAAEHPDALLILPKSLPLPDGFAPAAELTGFNYSIGKWTTLVIAQRGGSAK